MESSNKVKYMTPEEIRGLPTSQIASMTMISGDVILVDNKISSEEIDMSSSGQNVVLRAKKETIVKEGEEGEEKVEEKVEIDIEPQQGEVRNAKNEVLRGPDGKPLLNEILTGGEFEEQAQQPSIESQFQNDENVDQQNNYPISQEGEGQFYEQEYDPNSNQQIQEEQQEYIPEENIGKNNNNGYQNEEQYYPPEDPNYGPEQGQVYPQDINSPEVQEQYVEPTNQDYPQEYVPDPNNQGVQQDPNSMYPTLDENNNQQEYPQSMEVPEQQGYYPENQPLQQNEEPMTETPYQEPIQQPILQPTEQEYYPPENQPIVQPPVQQPIETPVQQPIQPPVQQPIQPPVQQPIQPSVQPKIPTPQYPRPKPGKGFVPQQQKKKQVVQIKFGFGGPMIPILRPIAGPMRPIGRGFHISPKPRPMPKSFGIGGIGFFPSGKKFVGGKQRIIINPVGKIMNFVQKVVSPFPNRIGLRSNNPNAAKRATQEVGQTQENILRARRDVNNFGQEEVLCPECCEECYGEQYGTQYGNNYQYYGTQAYPQGDIEYCGDNYNYHEIVETSDNSKTHVVVKKGGVTIADQ